LSELLLLRTRSVLSSIELEEHFVRSRTERAPKARPLVQRWLCALADMGTRPNNRFQDTKITFTTYAVCISKSAD